MRHMERTLTATAAVVAVIASAAFNNNFSSAIPDDTLLQGSLNTGLVFLLAVALVTAVLVPIQCLAPMFRANARGARRVTQCAHKRF